MNDTSPTFPIQQMLDEIKSFEWSLFPPTGELRPEEDQVLGLCPEELRRFFSFGRFCERELKQLQVEMEYSTDKDPDSDRRLWQLSKRHDIALALFWFCVWEHFGAYGSNKMIGVRKEWKVVLTEQRGPRMPPFFQQLFGTGE